MRNKVQLMNNGKTEVADVHFKGK